LQWTLLSPHQDEAQRRRSGLAPLTLCQLKENKAMKKVHIATEWSHGQDMVSWKEVDNWASRKLDLNAKMVCSSIRVEHLFANIHVCFHQSNISISFNLSPLTLEEHLWGKQDNK
jgi:hypothetical protein